MNIKEHYTYMSRLYFHQTILFAVVFAVIILPNIKKADFFLSNIAGLAIFLCMVYFSMRFIYFTYKSNAVSFMLYNGSKGEKNHETFLLIPSHSSNSLLEAYSSDGIRRMSLLIVKGKERQNRLKYHVLGNKGRLYKIHEHGIGTTAYMHEEQSVIQFISDNQSFPVIINKREAKKITFIIGPDYYVIEKSYSDRLLLKNGQVVMSVKRGMMPIKWQQYFHPNTPLLKINSLLSKEERSLCLCLITLF